MFAKNPSFPKLTATTGNCRCPICRAARKIEPSPPSTMATSASTFERSSVPVKSLRTMWAYCSITGRSRSASARTSGRWAAPSRTTRRGGDAGGWGGCLTIGPIIPRSASQGKLVATSRRRPAGHPQRIRPVLAAAKTLFGSTAALGCAERFAQRRAATPEPASCGGALSGANSCHTIDPLPTRP